MSKSYELLSTVLLGSLFLVARAGFTEEIPSLPLNQPLPLEQDNSWMNEFGGSPTLPDARATLTRMHADELEIQTPHHFPDGVSELIFADAEGRFTASWCSGHLAFASLVLPQIDEAGALKEWRTIPMLDLAGQPLSASALEAVEVLAAHRTLSENRE